MEFREFPKLARLNRGIVDATLTAATDTELRRRITEGDQRALAELNRRRIETEAFEHGVGQAA